MAYHSQVLGNGKEITQLAFSNEVALWLLLTTFLLKPLSTILCLGSGVPGGLFTPSLALRALLGGVLVVAWSWVPQQCWQLRPTRED
jgi:H+/Cl- antiporter ClcA